MKQLHFILPFLLITSFSFSQEIKFELKSTEIYKDKILKRNYGFESLGKNNSHFYYIHLPFKNTFGYRSVGSNEIPNILMFDFDLNLIKKQALNLESDNKTRDYEGAVFTDKKIYILSSFQNTQHKKHYLFVQSMNSSTLEANNDLKKIGEIDYSGMNKYFKTYFNLELSEDKSKFLIYYNIISKENVNLKYGMYVFDNSFNMQWKHENVLPKLLNRGSFLYNQFKIDNSGNVYIKGEYNNNPGKEGLYLSFSGKIKGAKLTYFSKYPERKPMIMYISNKGTKQDEIIIDLPNKSVHNMSILPLGNGNILCAGSYSENNLISVKGLLSFKYNIKTKKYGTIHTKELKRKLENTGLEEKFFEDFTKEVNNSSEWDPFGYLCSDIIKNEKGEYVCVAEQFLEGVSVTKSGNVVMRTVLYVYNDLFQFTVTNSGEIKNINQIHKRQYTDDSNMFSSYYTSLSGNKQYFLFTDFVRDETFKRISKPTHLYIATADDKGNIKKQAIYTPDMKDSDEIYFLSGSGMVLSNNKISFAMASMRYKYYAIKKLLIK